MFKNFSSAFFTPKAQKTTPLYLWTVDDFKKVKDKSAKARLSAQGFDAAPGQVAVLFTSKGDVEAVYAGIKRPLLAYGLASVLGALGRLVSTAHIKTMTLSIVGKLTPDEKINACFGYAIGGYAFTPYKPSIQKKWPKLVWPAQTDRTRVAALLDAIAFARDLINTPSNDMGPDELAQAVKDIAEIHDAKCTVIRGDDLLKKNYPLIHAVGRASPRQPLLVDLRWGNPKHKRVTLVGKGVVFDTGGLNIKPPASMILQKKDMAGAAHMLALAHIIMSLKLPICLRLLIPSAENAISGNSFRPRDIITSRKGLTIEIGDTDAEGRLLLADALTEGCSENPDLIIDMGTLTGAAHYATGYHLGSLFAHKDETAKDIERIALSIDDPLWHMPLWEGYRKDLHSHVADLYSVASSPPGSITAALFLEHFVEPETDWVHIDFYAWEQSGRPGRPVGATEFALRAFTQYLEHRYAK